MKKNGAKILLAVLIMSLTAFPAMAWDEVGHKTTAFIAWQRMTPQTRENVIKTMLAATEDSQLSAYYMSYGSRTSEARKREFFMLASTWSDIIRDRNFETRYKKYNHSNWHYSDTFWTVTGGKVDLINKPDEGGLALEKINEFDKAARDASTPNAQKALAIAWLEHLIGDISQPLHASARVTDTEPKGDQGGNLFLLTPKDTPREKQKNLHGFWDSIVMGNKPNSKDLCDADYIDPIARKIMKMNPFAKMQGILKLEKSDDWRKESFEIASTKVFPSELKRFETPTARYKKAALKISEQRLALAGYRMGELFNQIFGKAEK